MVINQTFHGHPMLVRRQRDEFPSDSDRGDMQTFESVIDTPRQTSLWITYARKNALKANLAAYLKLLATLQIR